MIFTKCNATDYTHTHTQSVSVYSMHVYAYLATLEWRMYSSVFMTSMSLDRLRWSSWMMSVSRNWVSATMLLVGLGTMMCDTVEMISPATHTCTCGEWRGKCIWLWRNQHKNTRHICIVYLLSWECTSQTCLHSTSYTTSSLLYCITQYW